MMRAEHCQLHRLDDGSGSLDLECECDQPDGDEEATPDLRHWEDADEDEARQAGALGWDR